MIVRSPLESDTHMKVEKINIVLAFIAVLLIWTTTPLAIKWSSGNAPMTSALLRMSIGVLFCLGLLAAFKHSLPFDKAARRVYLVGGVSIFVGMSLFYFAAQSIPSGWIAVLFGLSPLATGVFSAMLEPETRLTGVRIAGLCLGFAGLYLVFSAGLKFDEASLEGVIMTLMATLVTAATSVISRQLVKDMTINGMQITAGSLLVAVPCFAAAAFYLGSPIEQSLSNQELLSTLYLGLIGTGIGFTLYYYLLKRITATRISMIALITPISALSVGSWLNNEPMVGEVWIGASLICAGLLLYEFKPRLGLHKL